MSVPKIYTEGYQTMNISSIQQLTSTAATGSVASSSKLKSPSDAETAQSGVKADEYTSSLSEIATKYDVTHMTAQQVSDLANELNAKGLISIGDFAGLALVPYLMNGSDVGASTAMGADGAINLSTYWKNVTPDDQEASGLKLFASLTENRKKTAGSGNSTTAQPSVDIQRAAASYMDAIKKSTADPKQVANLLDALVTQRSVNASS